MEGGDPDVLKFGVVLVKFLLLSSGLLWFLRVLEPCVLVLIWFLGLQRLLRYYVLDLMLLWARCDCGMVSPRKLEHHNTNVQPTSSPPRWVTNEFLCKT